MYLLILICLISSSIKGYVLNNHLQIVKVDNKYLGQTIPLQYNSNRSSIKNIINNDSKINKKVKFKLPNTLLIKNKYRNNPILSIDLGSKNVGISFNYLNEFQLYKNIQFINYDQLVGNILNIIKQLYNKYHFNINIGGNRREYDKGEEQEEDVNDVKKSDNEDDEYSRLLVLIGLPYHSNDSLGNGLGYMGFNTDSSQVNNNLKLLYQILYTLDFGSYLSYHLNQFVKYDLKNKIFNTNRLKSEENEEYIHTHCLYCSIINNTTSNTNTSTSNTDSNSSSTGKTSTTTQNSNNSWVDCGCRLNTGASCLNTIKVSDLNMGMVLGINENYSTFQTQSLLNSNPFNQTNLKSERIKNKSNLGTNIDNKNLMQKNKNSLSALNIYYNLVNNKNNNFLILPNNNPIFNNTKSHNILLYKYIKNFIISNNFA